MSVDNFYPKSWFPSPPDHWTVQRLEDILTERASQSLPEDDIFIIRQGELVKKENPTESTFVSPSGERSYKQVLKEDFVYHSGHSEEGLIFATSQGAVSNRHLVFQIKSGVLPEFFYYLTQTIYFSTLLQASLSGLKGETLDVRCFLDWKIPLPPMEEQVEYLEKLGKTVSQLRKTRQYKAQQRNLLEFQKKSMIHTVVTKGIGGERTWKESSLSWVDKIPESWEVVTVATLFSSLNHQVFPVAPPYRDIGDKCYDYYGAQGVMDKIPYEMFDDTLLLLTKEGGQLLAKESPLTRVVSGKFAVNQQVHVLKSEKDSLSYYGYLLELVDFSPYLTGQAHGRLGKEKLLSMEILRPPREEQDEIVLFLEEKVDKIQKAKRYLEREIKLLQEYKKKLLTQIFIKK